MVAAKGTRNARLFAIAQSEWNGYRVAGIVPDYIMRVSPQPGYVQGRKALRYDQVWQIARREHRIGVLWIDPDIAADPDDLAVITDAITSWPADTHTAAVKLWPASTARPDWIWSHRGGDLGKPVPTQDVTVQATYVATGFLYTPARLLDQLPDDFPSLQFTAVDVCLSETGIRHGIPVRVAWECRPRHLHF